jgi:peptidyl-prolyl cis-trans isomerase C
MRLTSLSVLALAAGLMAPAAFADAPAANQASSDPLLATVNGMEIHLSDIQKAAQNAPQQLQQMPPNQLFPLLLNQEIDRDALLVAAREENLEKQPAVAASMAHAANISLENAYVQQHVGSAVTDAAVKAEYEKNYAGKPGPEQVEARHILVKTQAEAEAIINQLNHGANFAALAEKDSIDPGAKNGGELGWFTKDEMVPAFADAAFALKPGQYTKTPVHSQFGWHVILVQGRRTAPAPALADVQDQIRQSLADQAIQNTLAAARAKVKITINNPGGAQAAPTTTPATK